MSKLGKGSYSEVFKVVRKSDGVIYALKKVLLETLSQKERENALNEVRILASLTHEHIVGYKEAFLAETKYLCIIMEFASEGDVYQKILKHRKEKTHFTEGEVWRIFIGSLKALACLHDLNIFHRDIKSANIFIDKKGTALLGDLNVSKIAQQGMLYTQTGTPYYASPEVWKDQPYDNKSDIWSLGCVIYEVIALVPPFRAKDMNGLYKRVVKGTFQEVPQNASTGSILYSKELNQIVSSMIRVKAKERPSCDDLLRNPELQKQVHRYFLPSKSPSGMRDERQFSLLQTIKVPKNLKNLDKRLPKAQYEEFQSMEALLDVPIVNESREDSDFDARS